MWFEHLAQRLKERTPLSQREREAVLWAVSLARLTVDGESGFILVYKGTVPIGLIPVEKGIPKTFLNREMVSRGSPLAIIRWKLVIDQKVELKKLPKAGIWDTAHWKWHSRLRG